MNINGKTRLCGLIGNPVEHTMSPVIHNMLAEETGQNLVYVPFRVDPHSAGEFYHEEDPNDAENTRNAVLMVAIHGAYALNLLGLNVTVPYKQEVIPYLAQIDPLAAKIGAVNTLVRSERSVGFQGYNTDMPGLYRALQYDGVKVEGEEVLLLGAGGVARAVAILLLEKGAANLTLLNRSTYHAEDLAHEVNELAGRQFARALPLAEHASLPEGRRYLAIQATSVGMHPKTEEAVIEDPAFYRKLHTAYDLIFNPLETRFMSLSREQGARAFNGYRMLLYQGVISFELWTGEKISDELAMRVYRRMEEAMAQEG